MEVKINCLLRGESLIHDNVPCSNPIEMCVVSRAVTQSDDDVCVYTITVTGRRSTPMLLLHIKCL